MPGTYRPDPHASRMYRTRTDWNSQPHRSALPGDVALQAGPLLGWRIRPTRPCARKCAARCYALGTASKPDQWADRALRRTRLSTQDDPQVATVQNLTWPCRRRSGGHGNSVGTPPLNRAAPLPRLGAGRQGGRGLAHLLTVCSHRVMKSPQPEEGGTLTMLRVRLGLYCPT